MREVDIERTAYPRLLENITDREVVFRYTLEPEELSLVKNYKGNKLSLAVRLKVFGHLLSHNFPLSEVPQKVVAYMASQLQEYCGTAYKTVEYFCCLRQPIPKVLSKATRQSNNQRR